MLMGRRGLQGERGVIWEKRNTASKGSWILRGLNPGKPARGRGAENRGLSVRGRLPAKERQRESQDQGGEGEAGATFRAELCCEARCTMGRCIEWPLDIAR